MNHDSRPIGVFDSGIGGLTVLREMLKDFPNESFVYLGDTARLPYGSKSAPTVRQYSEQNMNFLISKNVKAIVVACNTASAQISESEYQGVPVYNVISPGSMLAAKTTRNNQIAVLATRATVATGVYEKMIKKYKSQVSVVSVACPLFVQLAEEGWHDDFITEQVAERYLKDIKNSEIDTVVLGCTHYPLLKKPIQKFFSQAVQLIDSGEAISLQLKNDFLDQKIAPSENKHEKSLTIYLTDSGQQFEKLSLQLLDGYTQNKIHFQQATVI